MHPSEQPRFRLHIPEQPSEKCMLWNSKLSELNKMLFCNCLGKLILYFTTIPGSHGCLNYLLCTIVPKHHNFSVKNEILYFCQKGQVLSPNLGQGLSFTLFTVPCCITYLQPLQMIMEPTGNQDSPRLLLQ